ncbi:MAG: hypothetical protein KY452_13595, partial [Actinobacteria bacterium]|nr:hypothetical protein [Actinomycetota bacterium]
MQPEEVFEGRGVHYFPGRVRSPLAGVGARGEYESNRLALDGPTLDDDETMVVELLSTNLEHIAPVLDSVGWRAVWEDLHGEECGEFVKAAGPTFWAKETYARKRDEVAWLAGGVTGEAAE